MAIALPLLVQIFEPIQMAVQWLSGGATPETLRRPPAQRCLSFVDTQAGSREPGVMGMTLPSAALPSAEGGQPQRAWRGPSTTGNRGVSRAASRSVPLAAHGADRPLRVVRVVDQRLSCVGAGRMVISGRMEDVCAELDRMAELETRH